MDTNNECKLRINTIRYPASFVISASVPVVAVSINSYLFYKVDTMAMKMGKDSEKNGSQRLLPTRRNQSIRFITCLYLLLDLDREIYK